MPADEAETSPTPERPDAPEARKTLLTATSSDSDATASTAASTSTKSKMTVSAPAEKPEEKSPGWKLHLCMLINTTSSVLLVITLKTVFGQIRCPALLTSMHLASNKIMLEVMGLLGFLQKEQKTISLFERVWVGATWGFGIVMMNTSLRRNTVGVHQILKMCIIPCQVLVYSLFLGRKFSFLSKMCLGLILCGAGFMAYVKYTVAGRMEDIFIGVLAVLATVNEQVTMAESIRRSGINSTNFAVLVTPLGSATALIAAYLNGEIEEVSNLFLSDDTSSSSFSYGAGVIILVQVFLSCVLALCLNVTQMAVMGGYTAVMVQVLGYAKTSFILLWGWYNFPLPLEELKAEVFGVLLCISGVVAYTYVQTSEKRAEAKKKEA